MKFNNLDGRTSTVDVWYVLDLASMDNPVDPREYTTDSGVLALDKCYTTADVLVNALDSVDVPDGTYAVKLVVDGITRSLDDCTYCARVPTCAGSYLVFFRVQNGTVKYLCAPEFVAHRGY